MDQAGPRTHREPPASASRLLGLMHVTRCPMPPHRLRGYRGSKLWSLFTQQTLYELPHLHSCSIYFLLKIRLFFFNLCRHTFFPLGRSNLGQEGEPLEHGDSKCDVSGGEGQEGGAGCRSLRFYTDLGKAKLNNLPFPEPSAKYSTR